MSFLDDLNYTYSKDLIALRPSLKWRSLVWDNRFSEEISEKIFAQKIHSQQSDFSQIKEISQQEILNLFEPGDLLLINDTLVEKRRVCSLCNTEFLFIKEFIADEDDSSRCWKVLFPAKNFSLGKTFELPCGVTLKLKQKGKPQIVSLNKKIDADYFSQFGSLAIPPYIQKLRASKENLKDDDVWYQTQWAKNCGSIAAPTASLHFSKKQIDDLKDQSVYVESLTLHIGHGTFLPLTQENIDEGRLHSEWCYIPASTVSRIKQVQLSQKRIWALGTTVTRAAESVFCNKLSKNPDGSYQGESDLFIQPGFKFSVVQGLLTNFHQPKSSLLSLVCAFSGKENVFKLYQKAIKDKMRLFSYGDLSVWIKK